MTLVLCVVALLVGWLALAGAVAFAFASRKAREARTHTHVSVRYIVVDVETSGLDARLHGTLEIAARAWDGQEFHAYVRPWTECVYDAKALEINGLYAYETFVPELDAVLAFAQWLAQFEKGWLFVGANPGFDYAFLEALQERTGTKLGLDYHKMDIQSMALAAHCQGRVSLSINPKTGSPIVKVDAIAEAFAMSRVSTTHGALEDVRLEEQLLLKLLAL